MSDFYAKLILYLNTITLLCLVFNPQLEKAAKYLENKTVETSKNQSDFVHRHSFQVMLDEGKVYDFECSKCIKLWLEDRLNQPQARGTPAL